MKTSEPQKQTVFEYMQEHGSIPVLSEGVRPWEYRGWLLQVNLQLQTMLEICRKLSGSAPYDISPRLLYALDGYKGEIPRIEFSTGYEHGNKLAIKNLEDCINVDYGSAQGWENFCHLTRWLTYGLGIATKEDTDYLFKSISPAKMEHWYRTFNLGLYLTSPADYFGAFICAERGGGKWWNPHAFYPTPMPVAYMMGEMMFFDANGRREGHEETKRMSFLDPCVGTGIFPLVASNYCTSIMGMDIDPLMVRCCRINMAWFAPWAAYNFKPVHEMQERIDRLLALFDGQVATKSSSYPTPNGGQTYLIEEMRCEEGEAFKSVEALHTRQFVYSNHQLYFDKLFGSESPETPTSIPPSGRSASVK